MVFIDGFESLHQLILISCTTEPTVFRYKTVSANVFPKADLKLKHGQLYNCFEACPGLNSMKNLQACIYKAFTYIHKLPTKHFFLKDILLRFRNSLVNTNKFEQVSSFQAYFSAQLSIFFRKLNRKMM